MATLKETNADLDNMMKMISGGMSGSDTNGFPSGFGSGMMGGFPSMGTTVGTSINIDDDAGIPMSMVEAEPVFKIDYKSTKKQCIKKALEQLTVMVKEIVPLALQDSKMITEKVKQDADQLGALYYEYEKADKMQQAIMDSVRRGDISPKLFEQFTKGGLRMDKLIELITTTQNQMRKYYIDAYMDLQQKDEFDEHYGLPEGEESGDGTKKALPDVHKEEKKDDATNVIVGTDNLIKMMVERKKKALMAKVTEATEVTEISDTNKQD